MVQVRQGNFGREIALWSRDTWSPSNVCLSGGARHEEDFDFHGALGTSELWVCK
jgi:hypothetical protein